jgi:hypothetical protein
MLSDMTGRRHARVALAVVSAAVLGTVLTTGQATAAAPQASKGSEAVIVVMRSQHPDLKPKVQASQRAKAVAADQAGIVSDLKTSGATNIQQLDTVSAVAAHASPAEVARLQANPAVAEVVPDRIIPLPSVGATATQQQPGGSRAACTSDPGKPQLEPEALGLTHTSQAQQIATGKGVKIAFMADGIDINNPEFIRPDGSHVFFDYQDFSGDGTNDASGGGEAFGDASSLAAQASQTYDLHTALPNAGLPAGCTFKILGFAPGASLAGIKVFGQFGAPESGFVRGIDYAVNVDKVDVLSQSFGANLFPDGAADPIALADEAATAAGVTVVASSGDSGQSGTVGTPASAPDVIAAAGTTSYRLNAQNKGYSSFVSNNISALSSGGPTEDNKYVDLVAPSVTAMAACTVDPRFPDCTQNSEVFGGTSQSAPFIAGASALVIQAYEDAHGGQRPSPALVKQLLTGTATDLNAPSDQQGAGLLNSFAAVQAAKAIGTHDNSGNALVPRQTQLDLVGSAGSVQRTSETLTNTSAKPQTVTETSRTLGAQTFQFNKVDQITNTQPAPTTITGGPGENPEAAPSFTFNVAPGTQWMTPEMRWNGTATSGQLEFELFDPSGALVSESYDFGFTDFQHTGIHDPTPGTWTMRILWGNGRDHFQEPVSTPGTFRGPVTVQITGSRYTDAGVNRVTRTIPAGGSATFGLAVPLSGMAGDFPASLQFDSNLGTHLSVPLARRVLIPTGSGSFAATITGGVGRGLNQYLSYFMNVPAGKQNMTVNLHAPDAGQQVDFFLASPQGDILSGDVNAVESAWQSGSGPGTNAETLTVDRPAAGRWELIALMIGPSSGNEFSEQITGTVRFDTVRTHSNGVPDSAATTIAAGSSASASVTVRNTGAAGAWFFLDPRSNSAADVTLPPVGGGTTISLPEDKSSVAPPQYLVPPHTTTLTQTMNATLPAAIYLEYGDGNPGPFTGTSGAGNTAVNKITSSQLPFGFWITDVGEIGPFPAAGAPAGSATISMSAHTLPFDTAVSSSTGDFWQASAGGGVGSAVFIPAGGTATIPVTVTPTAAKGTAVSGTIFVDTWNTLVGQGSELTGIPYSYTVG